MPAADPSRRSDQASHGRVRDEAGATLILALVFLVIVSATVLSLSGWAQGDLNSTRSFEGAQQFQSAANSATQVAIQFVRYNFMDESLNASPPTLCWSSSGPPTLTFNSESVDSWCSTRWYTGTSWYRIVTISTCLSSVSAATCETEPLLQAIVKVFDTDQSGNSTCSPILTGQPLQPAADGTCGQGISILDWAFQASPPKVSAVSVSGACGSGPSVTVTGTGFSNVIAVDAVAGSSASRMSALVHPSSSFSASGSTSITATFPAMPSGQYDIRISTSAGNSALAASSTFSC